MLRISRYLAVIFAVCLAVGETALNWEQWQFWPLWAVDYLIVIWLLIAAWLAGRSGSGHHLPAAWAFTTGVLYMAFFGGLDELRSQSRPVSDHAVVMSLIALMLLLAVFGLVCSVAAVSRATARQNKTGSESD
jgi:hypothetical protein